MKQVKNADKRVELNFQFKRLQITFRLCVGDLSLTINRLFTVFCHRLICADFDKFFWLLLLYSKIYRMSLCNCSNENATSVFINCS